MSSDALIFGSIPKKAIEPEELAVSLSKICRFAGHLPEHYSVAQHSVFVADQVPDNLKLAALLHDAHEAIIGDIPLPISRLLGEDLYDIKYELDGVIGERYGLSRRIFHSPELHKADRLAAVVEYFTYRPPNVWWPDVDDAGDPGIRVTGMPPEEAAEQFLARLQLYMSSDQPAELNLS